MYINLHLHLLLFNFAYLFFLFFLSFPLNIFVSFVFTALFPTGTLLQFYQFVIQLIFNVYNLLHLLLFNFTYQFFLSFLSSQHICQFCVSCFIPHLAPCFSSIFQFLLQLVLFLTGKYNFLFILLAGSFYCIFVELFSLCSWVYMYMCIFHYFNYCLLDFVAAICLRFIFGFLFLGIYFNPI